MRNILCFLFGHKIILSKLNSDWGRPPPHFKQRCVRCLEEKNVYLKPEKSPAGLYIVKYNPKRFMN